MILKNRKKTSRRFFSLIMVTAVVWGTTGSAYASFNTTDTSNSQVITATDFNVTTSLKTLKYSIKDIAPGASGEFNFEVNKSDDTKVDVINTISLQQTKSLPLTYKLYKAANPKNPVGNENWKIIGTFNSTEQLSSIVDSKKMGSIEKYKIEWSWQPTNEDNNYVAKTENIIISVKSEQVIN